MANDLTIKCGNCGLKYEYQDGITCPKCNSNNRMLIVNVNEKVSIPENNTMSLVMVFDLYDSVQIGGTILNSQNLEFIIDSEYPNSIKQFQIKLINPTQLDEKKALEQALEITNYLSLKANRTVKHKLPIIRRIVNGKMTNSISYGVDTFLHKNFDLDANYLDSKLLNKNPDLNKRLQLYNDGLKEFENNDFAGAIQSFYQCIENTSLITSEHKALRDSASHQRINNLEVIEKLTEMKIDIKQGEPLNENNPQNQLILSTKAHDLKQIAWNYLDIQLSNL